MSTEKTCASLEACLAAVARMERPLRAERPQAVPRMRKQLLQAALYALAARAEALSCAAEVGEADSLEHGHHAYVASRELALGGFSLAGPEVEGSGTPMGFRPFAAGETAQSSDSRGCGLLGMAEEASVGAARLLGDSRLATELEGALALAEAHRAHVQLLAMCDALEATGCDGRQRMYALMANGRPAAWEPAAARCCPGVADGSFSEFAFAALRAQGRRTELLGLPPGLAEPFAMHLKAAGDAELGWVFAIHRGRMDEAAEWLERMAEGEEDVTKAKRVEGLARLAKAADGAAPPLQLRLEPPADGVPADCDHALGALRAAMPAL